MKLSTNFYFWIIVISFEQHRC